MANIFRVYKDSQVTADRIRAENAANNAVSSELFVVYATFALAIAGLVNKGKRLVQITTDETNSNQTTLYWWTGTALQWIPTVEV